MNWKALLHVIGPGVAIAVAATVPGGAMLAPIIVNAIDAAEQLPGASGSEKKAHALELVQLGAEGVNVEAKRTVLDPAAVAATAGHAIDAVVGTVNIVHTAQQAAA